MERKTYLRSDARVIAAGIGLVILVILLAGLLAKHSLAAPSALPTATRTRTRTPTITPRRTPTRTPVTNALKKQLVFGGMGGGGGGVNECISALSGISLGQSGVISAGRTSYNPMESRMLNYVILCLYGIPYWQGFGIDLYRPDGSMAGHGEFSPTETFDEEFGLALKQTYPADSENYAYAKDFDNNPVIYFKLWMPAGAPAGQWYASAYAPNGTAMGGFDVPPWSPSPIVTLGRPPKYLFPKADPLDPELGDYVYSASQPLSLKSGDSIKLYGVGFKPNAATPIGAYRMSIHESGNDQADLFGSMEVVANLRGEWVAAYTVKPNEPPGDYLLITVLDTNSTGGSVPGPHFPYSVVSWQPCSKTYPSMLFPGMRAKVIEGQKSNRLRSQPTRYGDNVIGSIPAGQPFDILDGPRCADDWVWWYVRTRDGQTGWTSEGDRNQRWLVPVE